MQLKVNPIEGQMFLKESQLTRQIGRGLGWLGNQWGNLVGRPGDFAKGVAGQPGTAQTPAAAPTQAIPQSTGNLNAMYQALVQAATEFAKTHNQSIQIFNPAIQQIKSLGKNIQMVKNSPAVAQQVATAIQTLSNLLVTAAKDEENDEQLLTQITGATQNLAKLMGSQIASNQELAAGAPKTAPSTVSAPSVAPATSAVPTPAAPATEPYKMQGKPSRSKKRPYYPRANEHALPAQQVAANSKIEAKLACRIIPISDYLKKLG